MKCGIYGIKNLITGKWYVGQSCDLRTRMAKHLTALRGKYHCNEHLKNSFIKYGIDNFEFHVLEEVFENMLDVRERAWITFYKSNQPEFGYNMDTGGNLKKTSSIQARQNMSNAHKGIIQSLETRQKRSQALKGKKRHLVYSTETLRKMSEAQKGKIHSIETRAKMSAWHKGKVFSPKTRQRMSDAQKGKILSAEHRLKLSQALKGKPLSLERRKAMSEATTKRYANRKEL